MFRKLILLLLSAFILISLSACSQLSNNIENVLSAINRTDVGTKENKESCEEIISNDSKVECDDNQSQTQPYQPTTTTTTSVPTHVHSYSNATCTTPKSCTCGAIAGTALGHNYSGATCTSPQICINCGITEGSPLGHKYIEPTCTTPKICERCENVAGENLGHNYTNEKCTRCGKLDRTYLIEDIEVFSKSNMVEYNTNSIMDNCSNTYSGHYTIHSGNLVNGGSIKFEIKQKYSKFSGTMFLSYEDRSSPFGAVIKIYGDDRLLYQTQPLKEGSVPENFTINITGVSMLKIVFENYSGTNYDAVGYITNAYLSR